MPEEKTFYQSDGVTVSSTRVILNGTTYATANITSVRKTKVPANGACAVVLATVAAVVALFTIPFIARGSTSAWLPFLIEIGVVALGVFWYRSLKPTYHVMIASASGERQGFSSRDEITVNRVTAAVADAIAQRG